MRWTSLVLLATFVLDSTQLTRTALAAPRVVAPALAADAILDGPRPTPVPGPRPTRAAMPVRSLIATDAFASVAETDPAFALGEPGASAGSSVTFEHTYPAGWSLASVPLVPDNAAPSAVFDEIAAPLRLYDYVEGHVLAPGETGARNVAAGRAYWLLLENPTLVRVAGQPVATGAVYGIALRPGWNAIATPWLFATEWTDAQVSVRNGSTTLALDAAAAATWIDAALEDPAPGGGYQTITPNSSPAGRLLPWRGYEVFSRITGELILAPPPPDSTPPTASFTGLDDGATVTAPIEISGTVDDANLVEWRLEYAPTEGGVPVVLGRGDGPVTNGVLGTLDPTLLLNGTYDVRLVAIDAAGTVTSVTHSVVVSGDMKVGNFSLSFLDLEVPLAGLPIRLLRTYDSRDHRRGDFGIGWRLELANLRLSRNLPAGAEWEGTSSGGQLPTYCIQPTRSHLVTVTFPEGKVYEFEAVPNPQCQRLVPLDATTVTYRPRPGTVGTLAPVGNADVLLLGSWPGQMQLVDFDTVDVFDPQVYQLTLPDGRAFVIDRQQGLQSITDLSGNQLTVGPNGVVHSSGIGVAFTRDSLGRITAVTDPAGNVMSYGYDGTGDLVAFTDREENVTTFTYNAAHGLLSIQDPRGVQPIRNDYDDAGRVVRHTDALGKTIEYTHDVAGRQQIITNRLGQARVLAYDERGNVVQETDEEGKTTTRTFDVRGNKLTETDPLGRTTTSTYDAADNVLTRKDPLGNTTRFTYNARRQILTVTDPRGKVTTNVYDADGNLASTTDPLGKATTYTYDAQGQVLTEADALGCVKRYEYDARGYRIREIDALGHATTFTYDANGNRLTQARTRTVRGALETLTTTDVHDRLGRLVETTDPDGSTFKTEYDALGRVTATIDKLGRRKTFEYDDMGRLVRTTFPDGTAEESTFDAEGRELTKTDRGGRLTRFEYDGVGRVVKVTRADGTWVTNSYDALGRRTAESDARRNVTSYEYDAAGRVTKLTDAGGEATTFVHDEAGNLTSFTDARGQTTGYEYDDVNRRTRTVFPGGSSRGTVYDAAGRPIKETDQGGRTTQFAYDCRGQLLTVTDALGQVTAYTYDEAGGRISQRDAAGRTTAFEYDRLGRQTSRTLPLGHAETRTYDAAGNLINRTDFTGATATYVHDLDDRLLSRSAPDGSAATFTYTATGPRATSTDTRGTTSYAYDSLDRPLSITSPGGHKLQYGYDAQGNRVSLTATSGGGAPLAFQYAYDSRNRLTTVTDPLLRSYTHEYDANGNRTALLYPNGVRTTYTYDSLNRLKALASVRGGATIQSYTYTLGPAGNRIGVGEQDGSVRSYTYDALYRLTGERVTGGLPFEKTFTYDAVGNRVSQVDSRRGATAYAYDERDRLLSEGSAAYTWDDNGNLISRSSTDGAAYVWDFEGRLRRVTKADGTVVVHAYDADGNRVRTEVTPPGAVTAVTTYLVDPVGLVPQVVTEDDAAGNLAAYYVRGHDLLAVVRGGGTRFFHADGLGSTRRLTDEGGNVTDSYTFSAFGEREEHVGSDPNAYQFAGESVDPNSGSYYNRARWLDPGTGRFLSLDPAAGDIAAPLSLHVYLYANADPVNRIDPTGRFALAAELEGMSLNTTLTAIALPKVLPVLAWVGVRLLIAGALGVGAVAGHILISNEAARRELARERVKTQEKVEEEARRFNGIPLFHYTDAAAVAGIVACSCLFASSPFESAVRLRPSGAYATPIPPWHPTMTQQELQSLILARSVSHFVAVDSKNFVPIYPHEWVALAAPGGTVGVKIIFFGVNLMLPNK
jgi:RHS repeat-associated protein